MLLYLQMKLKNSNKERSQRRDAWEKDKLEKKISPIQQHKHQSNIGKNIGVTQEKNIRLT